MTNRTQRPRIAIAFYGITRSLKYTIDSIRENVIDPARVVGEVTVFSHFFKQADINNPRTGEVGALDTEEWQLLQPDVSKLDEVDLDLEDRYIRELMPYGNAWEDEGQSLRNILRQMVSLQRVTTMIQERLPTVDLVFFLRADMEYHDRFPVGEWINVIRPYTVMIPFWQWSGGLNDRFAICGRQSYAMYGARVTRSLAYCQHHHKPMHSERLLMFVLMRSPIQLAVTSMRATRVRSNGQRASETFSQVKIAKRIDGFLRCNLRTAWVMLRHQLGW